MHGLSQNVHLKTVGPSVLLGHQLLSFQKAFCSDRSTYWIQVPMHTYLFMLSHIELWFIGSPIGKNKAVFCKQLFGWYQQKCWSISLWWLLLCSMLWHPSPWKSMLKSPSMVSRFLSARTSQKEIPFSKCKNGHWRGGKLSQLSYGIYLQETCFPVVFIESMHKCFFL